MKFALVDGIKQEAAPKLKGVCCSCGASTQAKCGTRKVWHWAHLALQHCDSWWESETEWHRLWKGYFPYQNQEVTHFDEAIGEKHIADIKTDNGMVIEIQNSPMNETEMFSREHFYGKMIWIINGHKFKNNFMIQGKLPDPKSEVAQDAVFFQPISDSRYVKQQRAEINNERGEETSYWVGFFLKSDNPNYEANSMVRLPYNEDSDRVLKEIQSSYIGHHLFIWKNARNVWYQSTKPVFIDFGGDELWRLMDYDSRGLKCVKKISKKALIEKNGGSYVLGTEAATNQVSVNRRNAPEF
jgi:competence protein CoiA